MPSLTLGNQTFATQNDAADPIIADNVVFPSKKLINHSVFTNRNQITTVGEGFFTTFDTTIIAKSGNSCFKYTMTSMYGEGNNFNSASYRIYVHINSDSGFSTTVPGNENYLIKDSSNNGLIASFGDFPDTGKFPYHPNGDHGMPMCFSHFDYTSHNAGDVMVYKLWIRTQGSSANLVFNRATNGSNTDYRASGVTTIIIEEFEK